METTGSVWGRCGVCTSVQASPATATLAGHQPPVCCDHRPLVAGRWCGGGRPRAQPSHQQVGLHHSTPPPPSGAPAPSPAPGHHLATPPPRLVTQCHACPCHHWPGHVETLHQTYAYLAMLAISNKFTTFIISYFLPKSVHASKAPRSPAPDRVLSTLSLISINDQFLFRHE